VPPAWHAAVPGFSSLSRRVRKRRRPGSGNDSFLDSCDGRSNRPDLLNPPTACCAETAGTRQTSTRTPPPTASSITQDWVYVQPRPSTPSSRRNARTRRGFDQFRHRTPVSVDANAGTSSFHGRRNRRIGGHRIARAAPPSFSFSPRTVLIGKGFGDLPRFDGVLHPFKCPANVASRCRPRTPTCLGDAAHRPRQCSPKNNQSETS